MGAKQFGARVKRLEDPALLTGRGRFVDDVKLAGTLEACFVRSPYAHARIRSIDAGAARALPGVHAVLTADDLPGPMATQPIPMILPVLGIKAFRTQLCLARDEVSYAGQTVALVVADSRYIAEDAAALVAVDYEVLPAISDCRDALSARCGAGAFRSHHQSGVADPDGLRRRRQGVRGRRARHRGGVLGASRRRHEPRDPRGAGELRAGERHAHRVVVDPDAASRPPRARRPARAQSRDHPPDRARRRRRVRAEGAVLRRGGGDPGRRAPARPPGQMDRGPARAFSLRHPGARSVLDRRAGARRRRKNPRLPRQHAA